MKTIRKLLIVIFITLCNKINAQVTYLENDKLKFDVNTNCQLRYYYFPNLQVYFDKLDQVYIYQEKGQWVKGSELPKFYGGYSLYNNVKVVITDYDEDSPYVLIKSHKKQFPYCSNGRFTYATASLSEDDK